MALLIQAFLYGPPVLADFVFFSARQRRNWLTSLVIGVVSTWIMWTITMNSGASATASYVVAIVIAAVLRAGWTGLCKMARSADAVLTGKPRDQRSSDGTD